MKKETNSKFMKRVAMGLGAILMFMAGRIFVDGHLIASLIMVGIASPFILCWHHFRSKRLRKRRQEG